MKKMKKVNKADYIFNLAIRDDEDVLQRAIALSEETKKSIFRNVGYRKAFNYMKCLQNIFTNKEIIELFEGINTNMIEEARARYTIQVFVSLDLRFLKLNLKKVNNNFVELFAEFFRLQLIEEEWIKANPKPKPKRGIGSPPLPINNSDYYPYGFS